MAFLLINSINFSAFRLQKVLISDILFFHSFTISAHYIVNFAGNTLYNSNSTSGSFIVNKYDGEKLETNISASVSNPYVGSDVKFAVNVDDGVEGNVILKINDDYYNVISVSCVW